MSYCPFVAHRNMFGKSGEGIHSIRFLGTPIMDYIFTIILAMILTWLTKIPLVLTTIGLFVFSIFIHMLFGVKTPVLEFMGFKC